MGQLLSIIAVAGIAVAVVALGKGSIRRLHLRTRRQAVGLLVTSVVVAAAAPTLIGPRPSAEPAAQAAPSGAVVGSVPGTGRPSQSSAASAPSSPSSPASASAGLTVGSPQPSAPTTTPLPLVVPPPAKTSTSSTTTATSTTTTTNTTTTTATTTWTVYANCAAMNVDYPHGVAREGGVDLVNGSPRVPQPKYVVNTALYEANPGRDGDHDGVACEK